MNNHNLKKFRFVHPLMI